MIRFLLDTNILTHWMRRHDRAVIVRAAANRRTSAISAVSVHEFWFGALSIAKPRALIASYQALGLPVIGLDQDDARVAGEIRAALRQAGTPIGPLDVLIAGQALARDLTLVTNNTREFSRVAGLRLEDWTLD